MESANPGQSTDEDHGHSAPAVEPIAVIGLACRLPGARNVDEYWRNLVGGVESVQYATLEELAEVGVPEASLKDPNLVPAYSQFADAEYFDAAFFGMSAREAQVRDPQHRLFLELAYTAFEAGGYDPYRYQGAVAVYAGTGQDEYQWINTRLRSSFLANTTSLEIAVNSHPDYVATLASYKLNLHGPSLTLHTACSTSLVAVHLGCEALRSGECDMALCGGVNIDLPLRRGYLYVEGGILSNDGHCRAFDAKATGTIGASGGGVLLLKRLSDALTDGDHIHAVVLGDAINNDGDQKVGFTAPSQDGQAAVIAQALAAGNVNPRSISYVEAHGTATPVGDPIEIAALSTVYQRASADKNWCAVASVKSNIGHLGPAAGAAGMIKAVLALERGLIPASLHYEEPNPQIRFDESPFYVNSALTRWESNGAPRRAAVSSFGMGGTNAHVILEQPPAAGRPHGDAGQVQLLQVSARTATALEESARRLAENLEEGSNSPDSPVVLADVAYTLRVGRRQFNHRLAVTATSLADAAMALVDTRQRITGVAEAAVPSVAFMFPGQGVQYAGMGAQLYRTEAVFRNAYDECCDLLSPTLGLDLRGLVFNAESNADKQLRQTAMAQPALFALEYALSTLWESWGIDPAGMIGHSIGEYVAATLSGVFTLSDALHLVSVRGRLMQELPPGAMLAVQLDEEAVFDLLPDGLSIAAINGPNALVISGPAPLVDGFAERLNEAGVGNRRLATSHAFHSPMMEPILESFHNAVAEIQMSAPQRSFVSNVSGDWITTAEVTDPAYWARHLREPVRFGAGLKTLVRDGGCLLIECGPGRQLCGLARNQRRGLVALPSLPGQHDGMLDTEVTYRTAGQLWTSGVELDRDRFGAVGRRVPLPTYSWERKYYWLAPDTPEASPAGGSRLADKGPLPVEDWFSIPVWRQLMPAPVGTLPRRCLMFGDASADFLAAALRNANVEVIRVQSGQAFVRQDNRCYTVAPAARTDYEAVLAEITDGEGLPELVVHAFSLDLPGSPDGRAAWQSQERGFFSLLSLVQALTTAAPSESVRLVVLTSGAEDVQGTDLVSPGASTVAGITKVVPLELSWLQASHVDLDPAVGRDVGLLRSQAGQLLAELSGGSAEDSVALRSGRRWRREFQPVQVAADMGGLPEGPGLREGGTYLITGGLGGVGISIAEDLASRTAGTIILTSRSGLPPRADWESLSVSRDPTDRVGRAIAAVRRIEQGGARVHVLAADAADTAEMRQVRDYTLCHFGRLDGIVHAAGIAGGGLAEVKERAVAEEVLRPKILGTLSLQAAFGDLDLDFVVLCSSVTAIAGGFGQSDYCAANNFLDAYARSAHGWRAPVISVNWGSWLNVGMAAEVAAPSAFRALQRGYTLSRMDHPVLTGRLPADGETPGSCIGALGPDDQWVLNDHRIRGVALLPGTAYLELARAAADAISPADGRLLELRDVAFIEPLVVRDGDSVSVSVTFEPGADGLDFKVVSYSSGVTRVHAQGSIALVDQGPQSPVDIAAIRERCGMAVREGSEATISHSGVLTFGKRWTSLRTVYSGADEELALLEASDVVAKDLARWPLHPALLDEATAFGAPVQGSQFIPLGYGRLRVHAPLTTKMWSHLRRHESRTAEMISADVSVYDETGQILVSITDFTMRRVEVDSLMNTIGRRIADQDQAAEASASGSHLPSPADNGPPIGSQVAGGISPSDGAEAFARLIGIAMGPQIVVSPWPVDQVIDIARQLTQQSLEGDLNLSAGSHQAHGAAYDPPRTDLEAEMAGIWCEVLGAEQIGVSENFFEIGGNSLIATQIISAVRKKLGVRMPMRTFFDDPTVAGAAAIISKMNGRNSG